MNGETEISNQSTLPSFVVPTNAQIGALLDRRIRPQFQRFARILWVIIVVFTLAVFVASVNSRYSQMIFVGMENLGALNTLGLPRPWLPPYVVGWDLVTMVVYSLVGIVIYWRKSTEWIAWFASIALITAGLSFTRPSDSLRFVDDWVQVPMLIVFVLGASTLTIFVYIFPDGHFRPRGTIWLALALVLYAIGFYVLPIIRANSIPWPPAEIPDLIFFGIALGALSQIYRYRRVSTPIQKQQTKLVTYGLALGVLGVIAFLFVIPLLDPNVRNVGVDRVLYILIGVPVFYISSMLLPLALVLSILYARLWDIDLIINRTIVYVSLTAILAGMFAASITLTQKIFIALTSEESAWATVLTTLIIVALFTPMKDRLQNRVDMRFKETAGAAKMLLTFADQVRARLSQVHPQQITQRVLDVAVAAFKARGGCAILESEGPLALIFTAGDWNGEEKVSVLLEATEGGSRLGTLALGAKSNGTAYSERDRELLQTVASVVTLAIIQDRASKI